MGPEGFQVVRQQGGEIRIHRGGVPARGEPDLRIHFMGTGDARESRPARAFGRRLFMGRKRVAVQEHDRQSVRASGAQLAKIRVQFGDIQGHGFPAVRFHPSAGFRNARVQDPGFFYVQGEQVRTLLGADFQRIGEAFGHEQRMRMASPLQ